MFKSSDVAKKFLALCALAVVAAQFSGCARRTEDDFDDRTLGQRPHVETVTPENRKDVFRP